MLTRAAQRQARKRLSRNLLASFQQLQLPWLCPAVESHVRRTRQSSNVASHTSPSPRPRSRSPTRPAPSKTSIRKLATAADAYLSSEDFIPFEGLSSTQQRLAGQPYQHKLSDLRLFNTSDIVTVPPQRHSNPPIFKRGGFSTFTGDTADLLPNLHACVQVGRLDRAAKLIQRMAHIYQPEANELVDAHHKYLCGLLDSLLTTPNEKQLGDMHGWFEKEIIGRGVAPDHRMLSIMLKASFAVRIGTRLERTIRHYLGIAPRFGIDVHNDVLASELFSDSELARILRMFPQIYDPPMVEVDLSATDLESPSAKANLPTPNDTSGDLAVASPTSVKIPEIKETMQKGLGLRALKRSLAGMYEIVDSTGLDEEATKELAYQRQERLEKDVLTASLERWREEAEDTRAMRARGQLVDPLLGSYVYEWVQEMAALVREDVKLSADAEQRGEGQAEYEDIDRLLIGPFLRFADPEKICAAAVIALITSINDPKAGSSVDKPLVGIVARVGNAVVSEIRLESIKSSILDKFKSLPSPERRRKIARLLRQKNSVAEPTTKPPSPEKSTEEAREAEYAQLDPTLSIRAKIGALFLSYLIKVAKLPVSRKDPKTGKTITQVQPVASHAMMFRNGKKTGFLRTNPELVNRLKREPVGSFIAKFLPMLIEPGKWTSLWKGPYLESQVQAVRFRDTSQSQKEYLRIAANRGDLKQVFAGLDVIGKVPWRINRPLLKVLTDAWNTGEAIGKLAPEEPNPDYPPAPDPSEVGAYRRWKSVVKTIENEVTGFHSQRCYQNFQLEVARAYANEKAFYSPHNVDFRGRAYPIPPYFNHMGSDYVRGLFQFAVGKELGETGLRWLKIHLANAYGFDKERLEDREAFSMDHLADIYDSATNPLDGKRWWLTGGHPWQTLAACMELKAALDSPVPSKFVSHLPIQQDGTCNGLQHYAALGGDSYGAQQVNLMPGDKPADIYSAVANLVKEEVSKAAANGNTTAQVLDGKLTRKVVKQPVMTNVYGVTYHGAKEQVRKQLAELLPKASLHNNIHLGTLSAYVTTLIFGALGKMFVGAQAIQQWLGDCGARISQAVTPEQIERIKARRNNLEEPSKLKKKQLVVKQRDSAKEDYQFKSTIVWTTPLGMPVVQPYRSAKLRAIKTSLQEIFFEESTLSDPVSKRKQLQAFPPNFIHSLDSCHMMLSALSCDEQGLIFSSVHDSFWTHACDVPTMNSILREAFVRMHTEDIIGRLREEFIARYKGCFHYAPIAMSSPLATRILALRRKQDRGKTAFTKSTVSEGVQVDELLDEYERVRLLRSEDPEEQAKGRAMVTPGSLFEEEPGAALPVVEDHEMQLLGSKEHAAAAADPDAAEVQGVEHADPGVDSDLTMDAEAATGDDAADTLAVDVAGNRAAKATQTGEGKGLKRKTKTKVPDRRKLFLWMPMSFPPAPKKGNFDVTTLRDSRYFFS